MSIVVDRGHLLVSCELFDLSIPLDGPSPSVVRWYTSRHNSKSGPGGPLFDIGEDILRLGRALSQQWGASLETNCLSLLSRSCTDGSLYDRAVIWWVCDAIVIRCAKMHRSKELIEIILVATARLRQNLDRMVALPKEWTMDDVEHMQVVDENDRLYIKIPYCTHVMVDPDRVAKSELDEAVAAFQRRYIMLATNLPDSRTRRERMIEDFHSTMCETATTTQAHIVVHPDDVRGAKTMANTAKMSLCSETRGPNNTLVLTFAAPKRWQWIDS